MTYTNPEDQKAYARKHYQDNKDLYKDRAKLSRPKLIERDKRFVVDYLRNHPCVDCGETDIEVLQFDHKELVGSKTRRVSHYLGSHNRLVEEIEKCDIRCANCHVRRTRKQLGWFRDMEAPYSNQVEKDALKAFQ